MVRRAALLLSATAGMILVAAALRAGLCEPDLFPDPSFLATLTNAPVLTIDSSLRQRGIPAEQESPVITDYSTARNPELAGAVHKPSPNGESDAGFMPDSGLQGTSGLVTPAHALSGDNADFCRGWYIAEPADKNNPGIGVLTAEEPGTQTDMRADDDLRAMPLRAAVVCLSLFGLGFLVFAIRKHSEAARAAAH